jgi:dolichyl-diphosphooligosaccharide--protein glycosyltransferase
LRGYSFVINLHCLFPAGPSARLYVAYAPLIVYGTLLAASIPVVGFNAILMSEHFGAFLAFLALHGALLLAFIRSVLPRRSAAANLILTTGALAALDIDFSALCSSPTF